MCMTIPPKLVA